MKLTTALRSTIAQDIINAVASGTISTPMLEIYTGAVPASMGGAISDTLLAELAMTTGAGTQSGGVITFDTISQDSSANATGIAGWARVINRDGGEAIYLTVSDTAGSGDLKLNTTSVDAGAPVAITSATITVGGA